MLVCVKFEIYVYSRAISCRAKYTTANDIKIYKFYVMILQGRILSRLLGAARLLVAAALEDAQATISPSSARKRAQFLFTNLVATNLPAPTARKLCVCPRHSTVVEQLPVFPNGRRMR